MTLSKYDPRSRKEFLTQYYVRLLLEKNKIIAFVTPDFLTREKVSLRKALFFKGIFVEMMSNKILKQSKIPYKGAGPAFIVGTSLLTLQNFVKILNSFEIEPTLYFFQNTFFPTLPEEITFPIILGPYYKETLSIIKFIINFQTNYLLQMNLVKKKLP